MLSIRAFIKNNWHILLSELLVLVIFIVFYGKFGDLMVDSYREVYIPQQILEGKALYKDLFIVYSPLSYLINAFIMKIFGTSVSVIYFAGLVSTSALIYFTAKISNFFLERKYTLSILLFIISGLVLSPNVFNSFLPYSFGFYYGLLFSLISVYASLNKKFPIAYLFYSLAILCKFEYLLLLPLLIFWSKKEDIGKNLLALFLPFLLTGIVLAIQGCKFENIKNIFELITIMCQTKTLQAFYSYMALTFRWELLNVYLINFIKFLFPINWTHCHQVIVWSFPVILICFIFRYKELRTKEIFFILASLLISARVFFALVLGSYGAFFIPLALVSLYILIPNKYQKVLLTYLLIWCFIIGCTNIKDLQIKKTGLNKVNEYILNNTAQNDRIVVFPECLNINVMTNRKSDNKIYSMIPLYVETFGENIIIERLKTTKPEYIIINNYDTSVYYYSEFGKDYAINIYNWIKENYTLETVIVDKWIFKVYRLK